MITASTPGPRTRTDWCAGMGSSTGPSPGWCGVPRRPRPGACRTTDEPLRPARSPADRVMRRASRGSTAHAASDGRTAHGPMAGANATTRTEARCGARGHCFLVAVGERPKEVFHFGAVAPYTTRSGLVKPRLWCAWTPIAYRRQPVRRRCAGRDPSQPAGFPADCWEAELDRFSRAHVERVRLASASPPPIRGRGSPGRRARPRGCRAICGNRFPDRGFASIPAAKTILMPAERAPAPAARLRKAARARALARAARLAIPVAAPARGGSGGPGSAAGPGRTRSAHGHRRHAPDGSAPSRGLGPRRADPQARGWGAT